MIKGEAAFVGAPRWIRGFMSRNYDFKCTQSGSRGSLTRRFEVV